MVLGKSIIKNVKCSILLGLFLFSVNVGVEVFFFVVVFFEIYVVDDGEFSWINFLFYEVFVKMDDI